MDDSNFLMKLDFINNFLENASDEQIDELFSKAVELVGGKSKHTSIPFQPVNINPYFTTPIVVPIQYGSPNYMPEIMCDGCLGCDEDEGNWYDLYRR